MPVSYLRLFGKLAVLLIVLVAACRSADKDDAEVSKYSAFLDKHVTAYYLGDEQGLIERLDSFYASQKNVPTQAHYMLLLVKSTYYLNNHKYDIALLYNDSAIAILAGNKQDKKNDREYAERMDAKGELLYNLGKYNEAYTYYFIAKQKAEQLYDSCMLGRYSYSLGILSYKQRKYAAGAGYFKQAVKYAGDCKQQDAWQIQEEIDNIALCYEQMRKPDSALYFYDSALSYLDHMGKNIKWEKSRDKAYGVVYGNKGSVLLDIGYTDSAISLLQKSYAINIKPYYDNNDALLTHLKLAQAYLAKNALDMVRESMVALQKEMDTIRHQMDAEREWDELLYKYYDKTGDLKEAFRYYREYTEDKDSIWESERKQMEADVVRALGEKEQEHKMEELEERNEANNMYLWVVVVFLVMVLAVVVLVYISYRKEKKNIATLTALKTELEVADKEKDKIMDIVVHDLRGPVSGVFTVADMMLTEGTRTPEETEWISMIKGASESALALINQLMAYKNESREAFVKEPHDIIKMVDDVIKLLQLRANEKGISLRKHLESSPVVILIDKEKINRVINNLVSNAIKFSSQGSAIDITVENKETVVCITIKDTGIGIPEKMKQDVFGMFTAAKRTGTAGEKSFGLGLSITKQIVEAHGGKIWMESEEGSGTTFFVELPK